MNIENSTKYIFVPQQKYKFAKAGEWIGSYGAGPCSIIAIYHENIGSICSHVDLMSIDIIDIICIFFLSLIKDNVSLKLSDIKILLTKSKENKYLRDSIIEKLRLYELTNIHKVVTSQIIVNASQYKIDFNIDNCNINIKKNINNLRNNLLRRTRHILSSPIIERPPYPNNDKSGLKYYYSILEKKWIKYR